MPATEGPRLLLVVGTGRSGTSTLTGVLKRLGYVVPGPEVAADTSNPRGFGEPRWVVDRHDALLARCGVQVADARPEAWDLAAAAAADPRERARVARWLGRHLADGHPLVVKDPRLAWFLPLWEGAAAEAGVVPAYVSMLRPPAEVVSSRRSRYNPRLEDAHGVAGWLNMVLGTEAATRGRPRAWVRYDALLTDWRRELARLGDALGLVVDAAAGGAGVDAFVEPALRRERAEQLDVPAPLAALAGDAWALLDHGERSPSELDQLRAAYAAYYRGCAAVARSSVIAAAPRGAGRPGPSRRPPMITSLTTALRRVFTARP